MDMDKKKDSSQQGIALGLCFGIVFWMAFDNLPLGIALGIAFGVVFSRPGKSKNDPKDPRAE